ncbi:hypothetical protein VTK73DRAFT_7427 [Phialemonium thermophilum]|uniref:Uncharacterized protein n=1 Tax=Phialemonium thermophilum TaxID=223376 RepID=A0ABR3WEF5_9PEZI
MADAHRPDEAGRVAPPASQPNLHSRRVSSQTGQPSPGHGAARPAPSAQQGLPAAADRLGAPFVATATSHEKPFWYPRPAANNSFEVSYGYREGGKHLTGTAHCVRLEPVESLHAVAVVLVHGDHHTSLIWHETACGHHGWSHYFAKKGYVVFVIDLPPVGRSAVGPTSATGVVTGERWELPDVVQIENEVTGLATSPSANWSTARRHTQWPGTGRRGDKMMEYYAACLWPLPLDKKLRQSMASHALASLLNVTGPCVLLAADLNPANVLAILAVEPAGPPFGEAFERRGARRVFGPSVRFEPGVRAYGVADIPLHFDPPVAAPPHQLGGMTGELPLPIRLAFDVERQRTYYQQREDMVAVPAGPGLAGGDFAPTLTRKLPRLQSIKHAVVTTECSAHCLFDWATVKFLREAGLHAEHLPLPYWNIRGNGPLCFWEKNSDQVAQLLCTWIQARLPDKINVRLWLLANPPPPPPLPRELLDRARKMTAATTAAEPRGQLLRPSTTKTWTASSSRVDDSEYRSLLARAGGARATSQPRGGGGARLDPDGPTAAATTMQSADKAAMSLAGTRVTRIWPLPWTAAPARIPMEPFAPALFVPVSGDNIWHLDQSLSHSGAASELLTAPVAVLIRNPRDEQTGRLLDGRLDVNDELELVPSVNQLLTRCWDVRLRHHFDGARCQLPSAEAPPAPHAFIGPSPSLDQQQSSANVQAEPVQKASAFPSPKVNRATSALLRSDSPISKFLSTQFPEELRNRAWLDDDGGGGAADDSDGCRSAPPGAPVAPMAPMDDMAPAAPMAPIASMDPIAPMAPMAPMGLSSHDWPSEFLPDPAGQNWELPSEAALDLFSVYSSPLPPAQPSLPQLPSFILEGTPRFIDPSLLTGLASQELQGDVVTNGLQTLSLSNENSTPGAGAEDPTIAQPAGTVEEFLARIDDATVQALRNHEAPPGYTDPGLVSAIRAGAAPRPTQEELMAYGYLASLPSPTVQPQLVQQSLQSQQPSQLFQPWQPWEMLSPLQPWAAAPFMPLLPMAPLSPVQPCYPSHTLPSSQPSQPPPPFPPLQPSQERQTAQSQLLPPPGRRTSYALTSQDCTVPDNPAYHDGDTTEEHPTDEEMVDADETFTTPSVPRGSSTRGRGRGRGRGGNSRGSRPRGGVTRAGSRMAVTTTTMMMMTPTPRRRSAKILFRRTPRGVTATRIETSTAPPSEAAHSSTRSTATAATAGVTTASARRGIKRKATRGGTAASRGTHEADGDADDDADDEERPAKSKRTSFGRRARG